MAGGETKPYFRKGTVDFFEEARKINAFGRFFPVGVNVLAKQGDIPHPLINQGAYFPQNIFRGPAYLPAPYKGDNTVGAEIVAALHYGYKRTNVPLSWKGSLYVWDIKILIKVNSYEPFSAFIKPFNNIYDIVEPLGPHDKIHVGGL